MIEFNFFSDEFSLGLYGTRVCPILNLFLSILLTSSKSKAVLESFLII